MVVTRAIKEIKSKMHFIFIVGLFCFAISDSALIHSSSYFNIVLRVLTF